MTSLQAITLGLVQGFSEFLPISSSGHLVLTQAYFGLDHQTVAFDVFLHFATLLAVILYFRTTLLHIKKKYILSLIFATIPAVIVGLLFEEYITQAFSSVVFVGFGLLISGTFNLISGYKLNNTAVGTAKTVPDATPQTQETQPTKTISHKQAVVVGLLQAFAILPGVSRSGSTVFAGIIQNIDRKLAFEFSFLLSIPVIFGANILQVARIVGGQSFDIETMPLLLGGLCAFFAGLVSLKLLEIVITKAKISYFGIYCIVVGLVTLFTSLS